MVRGNAKVVRTENSTFNIIRSFPPEETESGKRDGGFDYKVQQYSVDISEDKISTTRPRGTIFVDRGELEKLTGVDMPTYPRCDCGRPEDIGGECTYCRHGIDPERR